jgi:hypothetical protein
VVFTEFLVLSRYLRLGATEQNHNKRQSILTSGLALNHGLPENGVLCTSPLHLVWVASTKLFLDVIPDAHERSFFRLLDVTHGDYISFPISCGVNGRIYSELYHRVSVRSDNCSSLK